MAGRPKGETEHEDVTPEQLDEQLVDLKVALHYAVEGHDGTAEHDRGLALLQRRLWNQQALVLLHEGDIGEAAKASRQAVLHGELAVKLARSTLVDRIGKLEATVGHAASKGAAIRAAARMSQDELRELCLELRGG